MRRSPLAAVVGLCVAGALLVAAGTMPAAAGTPRPGPATDRLVAASGPTFVYDPAYATVKSEVVAISAAGKTIVLLVVSGLPRTVWGRTLGAHVHINRCGRDPAAAGGHYVNPKAPVGAAAHAKEIWLDLKAHHGGYAIGTATVGWFIKPGAANSVVVHAMATSRTGDAGPRLVCADVPFGYAR
jgi:Cu-Zn family superoxide dismutase